MAATSIRVSLLLACILQCFWITPVYGAIVNENERIASEKVCPSVEIECPCGVNGDPFQLKVQQCINSGPIGAKCGSCNVNGTRESICAEYSNCSECYSTRGQRCSECPRNKSGQGCEYDWGPECRCQNGGQCHPDNGCLCPQGYTEYFCLKREGIVASCPDPGSVPHAEMVIGHGTPRNGDAFYSGARVRFRCRPGFLQLGLPFLTCLEDGEWISDNPICMKVSSIVLDCETSGTVVFASDVGVPVSIACPPECKYKNSELWGTSIYRINSAICPAAIHAGKITNSGGLVVIINNGDYDSFVGSDINNIQSQSYDGSDQSFRFDKSPPPMELKGQCPPGLVTVGRSCGIFSTHPSPRKEAEAICTNFGLALLWPDFMGSSSQWHFTMGKERWQIFLKIQGIHKLWTGNILASGKSNTSLEENGTMGVIRNNGEELKVESHEAKCEVKRISDWGAVPEYKNCTFHLHYFCIYTPSSKLLANCTDPGSLPNGVIKNEGKINEIFYVGSAIEYACDPLYYLEGVARIFCRKNGTWTDEKPMCIKVDTCREQPVPMDGFVNYFPPSTPMFQRSTKLQPDNLDGFSTARLPVLPNARPTIPTTTAKELDPGHSIQLSSGHHILGTTAIYECTSPYYNLVGSYVRRCQEKGVWSGRAPKCVAVCGRSDSPRSPFISHGNTSDIGQWPWQAFITAETPYSNNRTSCGGSLISEHWVITAAHCVTYPKSEVVNDPANFKVYLGKYYLDNSKDDEFVQTKSVHKIHIHPAYVPRLFDSDIALIQLTSPAQLHRRVQPVCLPTEQTTQKNLKPASKGVVTGWGLNENSTPPDTLKQAVLPVVSNEECERGYWDSQQPISVTENMFCAGFQVGRYDTCKGDSGGPMVFADGSALERRWVLEGIVSWGSPQGCGKADQYSGYTIVSNFLNWIQIFSGKITC